MSSQSFDKSGLSVEEINRELEETGEEEGISHFLEDSEKNRISTEIVYLRRNIDQIVIALEETSKSFPKPKNLPEEVNHLKPSSNNFSRSISAYNKLAEYFSKSEKLPDYSQIEKRNGKLIDLPQTNLEIVRKFKDRIQTLPSPKKEREMIENIIKRLEEKRGDKPDYIDIKDSFQDRVHYKPSKNTVSQRLKSLVQSGKIQESEPGYQTLE